MSQYDLKFKVYCLFPYVSYSCGILVFFNLQNLIQANYAVLI